VTLFRGGRHALLLVILAGVVISCGSGAQTQTSTNQSGGADVDAPPGQLISEQTATPATLAPASERIRLESSSTTEYYLVHGSTSQEIIDYMKSYGPQGDNGDRGSGLAEATPSYTWTAESRGGECLIGAMTIKIPVAVTLPRHAQVESLTPHIQDLWRSFAEHVAWHEQRHVEIYFEGVAALRQQMIGLKPRREGCDALEKDVEKVWVEGIANIRPQQDRFHSEEDARRAGERDRLKAEIATYDTRIAPVLNEIKTMTAGINAIDAELTQIEAQIAGLVIQMDAIRTQYGDAMPPPAYDLYERLRLEHNLLVDRYNASVSEYNAAVGRKNTRAAEQEALLSARNRLVDAFNLAP
jgi:predicted secreted Zn-dependent protease